MQNKMERNSSYSCLCSFANSVKLFCIYNSSNRMNFISAVRTRRPLKICNPFTNNSYIFTCYWTAYSIFIAIARHTADRKDFLLFILIFVTIFLFFLFFYCDILLIFFRQMISYDSLSNMDVRSLLEYNMRFYSGWHIWVNSVLHPTEPVEFCMRWKSNLMLYLSFKEKYLSQ